MGLGHSRLPGVDDPGHRGVLLAVRVRADGAPAFLRHQPPGAAHRRRTVPTSELVGLDDIAPEEALAYAIENPGIYDWEELAVSEVLSEESLLNELMPEELSTGDIIEELDDELLLELL